MKYISYIALLGASIQSAAAQDTAKGPKCTAYDIPADKQAEGLVKYLGGEGPKAADSDSVKNEFYSTYVYDTTKGECEAGLSCVQAQTIDKEQTCQKCYWSSRDSDIAAGEAVMSGGSYTPSADDIAGAAKNTYPDADGNTVNYKCYSDVLATRVVLSAGAVLAAVASMI